MFHLHSGRNIDKGTAAKDGRIQGAELVVPDRDYFPKPFPENFRMILQSLRRSDENDALLTDCFLNVRIHRFAIELRFDSSEKLAFLFRNAEPFEGPLYILWDIFPVSLWLDTAAEVITDLVEIDRLEILAGPMRRQRLFQECFQALEAEFAHPIRIFFDVRDVMNGFLAQTNACVVGMVYLV